MFVAARVLREKEFRLSKTFFFEFCVIFYFIFLYQLGSFFFFGQSSFLVIEYHSPDQDYDIHQERCYV